MFKPVIYQLLLNRFKIRTGVKITFLALAPLLVSCGKENPSFVNGKESYSIAVDNASGDTVAANAAAVNSDEASKILSDMDNGLLKDGPAWKAAQSNSGSSCNIVSAGISTLDANADQSDSGVEESSTNEASSSGASNAHSNHGKGKGRSHLVLANSCEAQYATKIHDGDDESDTHLRPSEQEDLACGAIMGVDQSQIVHLSGNMPSLTIRAASVISVKITGHQSALNLDLSKASGAIAGICLFAAGDQPKIDVALGLTVGRFVYVARGNQASLNLHLETSGDIKSSVFDAKGSGPTMSITGASDQMCSAATVLSDRSQFSCGI